VHSDYGEDARVLFNSASAVYIKKQDKQHTHTYPFNGPLSGTTQVSWYQKGKTNLDFTEARDSGWQWHQLGHMQVCTSLQKDNRSRQTTMPAPHHSVFTGRMPFLPPNQQRENTEGNKQDKLYLSYTHTHPQPVRCIHFLA